MYGLHQGYAYQDLLGAFLIAENLHRKSFKIAIELKENGGDFFDDITIIADGKKTKYQVKHSSVGNILEKNDFEKKSSDLNLEKLTFKVENPAVGACFTVSDVPVEESD